MCSLLLISSKHAPASIDDGTETSTGIQRIGVFPLWLSLDADNPLASEDLVTSWTSAILSDLQASGACEWIPLHLPESVDEESQTNFDTLIGKGMEANCSGLLILQVHRLNFQTKEVEIGRLSFIKASTDIIVTGSLIDVQNRSAVAEFTAESHLKDSNYKGSERGDVEYESIDSEYVKNSLFGRSIEEIQRDLQKKIAQNTDKIETCVQTVMRRINAPEGVQFLQEALDLTLSAANDQRFTVQVMNAGEETESFIVKPLNQINGVVIGLKGTGSTDEPCQLNPGEWKFIRLIANARPNAEPGAVVLGLVKMPGLDEEEHGDDNHDDGTAEDKLREAETDVHDKMTLNISMETDEVDIEMKILKQDPATLRYVCQLYNRSQEEGSVSLHPSDITGGSIVITPNMEDILLGAGQSTLFCVEPVFGQYSQRIEASVQGDLGGRSISSPFVFEIPPGKGMFWGTCGTSQSSSSGSGACLNEGEITITVIPLSQMSAGQRVKLQLAKFWAWLERVFGSDDHFNPPDHGNVPSGIRGARVRTHVNSCLPMDVHKDSTTCPTSAYGSDFLALASHQPSETSTEVVYYKLDLSNPAASTSRALSEPGHAAIWPEIAVVKETGQVLAVWEDAMDSPGAAIALRNKLTERQEWSDVQYLSDHSRPRIDPVVSASGSGAVAVAWEEKRDGRSRIVIRLSTDNGQTFLPKIVLPVRPDESQTWPRLAFHPSGQWMAVYSSSANNQNEISCIPINREGQIVGEATAIFRKNTPCGEPRLAINKNGDMFAVWRAGDGKESEIWFSASDSAGNSWTDPIAITADSDYSEYPKVKAFKDTVLVSYHSPVLDGRDLTFQMASLDRGKSWQQPKALISSSPWVEKASLELHFSLSWPRSDYNPFDTFIFLNDQKVGEILDTIPEGIYRFDIPGDLIYANSTEILNNEIKISAPMINSADNIILKSHRLVVKRHLTQIPVFAANQHEADMLARNISANVNHNQPDLSVSANRINISNEALRKGEKIKLDFDVHNMGETAAEHVRLLLFRSDPSAINFSEQAAKLAEAKLKKILAGHTHKVSQIIKFDPETTSSVFAVVRSKSVDYFLKNNGFRLSLIDGDSDLPSPLLGTDIPSLFQSPSLLRILKIRDLDGLKDFIVSSAFDKFWNSDLSWSFDPDEIKEDFRERFRANLRERFLDRLDKYKDFLEKIREHK